MDVGMSKTPGATFDWFGGFGNNNDFLSIGVTVIYGEFSRGYDFYMSGKLAHI